MPKAYWIAHVTITDEEHYPEYLAAGGPVYEKYGAKFIVRGGKCDGVEGNTHSRHVVVEFKDYETALAAYHSAEYQHAASLRQRYSDSELMVVEGVD